MAPININPNAFFSFFNTTHSLTTQTFGLLPPLGQQASPIPHLPHLVPHSPLIARKIDHHAGAGPQPQITANATTYTPFEMHDHPLSAKIIVGIIVACLFGSMLFLVLLDMYKKHRSGELHDDWRSTGNMFRKFWNRFLFGACVPRWKVRMLMTSEEMAEERRKGEMEDERVARRERRAGWDFRLGLPPLPEFKEEIKLDNDGEEEKEEDVKGKKKVSITFAEPEKGVRLSAPTPDRRRSRLSVDTARGRGTSPSSVYSRDRRGSSASRSYAQPPPGRIINSPI